MFKFILIFLIASQGVVGATSEGSSQISITIPPRVEITETTGDPEIETNFSEDDFTQVEETKPDGTTIIIYEPPI